MVEVLGLGNSLVDLLAYADDNYLSAQEMLKGAMNLIDEDRAEALYAARVDPRVISGGSAANTIVGVATFGASAAYIGKVKQDPLGAAFTDDIRSTGVGFSTSPAEQGPSTGRCFIYVTPDGERTMNTYLGASSYLAPVDVPEGRRDRPRREQQGGLDPFGLVLRRSVPRRVHRAHAFADRRYDLRQHRRGPVAI
jgi:sugar/nucleoside kinase (ribokinase family)